MTHRLSKHISVLGITPCNEQYVRINGFYFWNGVGDPLPEGTPHVLIDGITDPKLFINEIKPASGDTIIINETLIDDSGGGGLPGTIDQQLAKLSRLEPWSGAGDDNLLIKASTIVGNGPSLHEIENTLSFAGTGISPDISTCKIIQKEYNSEKEELNFTSSKNEFSKMNFIINSQTMMEINSANINLNDFIIEKNVANSSVDIDIPVGYSIRFIKNGSVIAEFL